MCVWYFETGPGSSSYSNKEKKEKEVLLTVQWLRPYAPSAWGMGSVPGWGTTIPHATGPSQNKQTATKTSKTKQNNKTRGGEGERRENNELYRSKAIC